MLIRHLAIGLCALVLGALAIIIVVRRPANDSSDPYFPLGFRADSNYHKLVSAKWVADLIKGNKPATVDGERHVILEVSASDDSDYVNGHVPGAVLVRTDQIERAPMWNLVSNKELRRVIEGLGITWDSTVVIYGRDTTAAARVLWTLMHAGVEDVRLLDGGLGSWKHLGERLEQGSNQPTPSSFGREIPWYPTYLATLSDVKTMASGNSSTALVDVRSKAEFRGKTSGYHYISAKGRIPSSVWGGEAKNGAFKDLDKVRKRWERVGITQDREITFYCGTGWRSSLAFFYAHLMGFKHPRNFDGSWLEWSQSLSNSHSQTVTAE